VAASLVVRDKTADLRLIKWTIVVKSLLEGGTMKTRMVTGGALSKKDFSPNAVQTGGVAGAVMEVQAPTKREAAAAAAVDPEEAAAAAAEVGLYKFSPVETRSLKATGFNP
jgi:hypothetical protein